MIRRPDIAPNPARILIVDDEHRNRQLLEVMLKPEGYHLFLASSGEEALAMVSQQPPDLILLDVMMPGMDGYLVAARIKDNPATTHIPILMITALDNRDARMRGLNAGVADFLSKPADRAELSVRVRNLLRLKAYGDYYEEQAALLDLAQDAIIVRDMQSRILFWSQGAEAMYGWPNEDALGRITYKLMREEFEEPIEQIEAALLREGRWEGEAIHHRRDGTSLTVATRWALQRDPSGVPVRILTINSDVTDRKAAAAALEQNQNDRMRFKDEFLSHVSDELRSPLTAIEQFTTILLGGSAGKLNAEQHEYQEIVLRNVQQLQSMIDDLLEVTRLETGTLSVSDTG